MEDDSELEFGRNAMSDKWVILLLRGDSGEACYMSVALLLDMHHEAFLVVTRYRRR